MITRRAVMSKIVGLTAFAGAAPALFGSSRAEAALDVMQNMIVGDINRHFNGVRSLAGEFVQIGPNGERAEGRFFMEKPGRLRFEYSPPSRLLIVANGRWVGISDLGERTTERYPLATTPLKLLLSESLDIIADTTIRDVLVEPDLVTIVIEERAGEAIGQLALMFDGATYDLKQWVITDAQGLETTVALYNTVAGGRHDRMLFVIPDYDRIRDNDPSTR